MIAGTAGVLREWTRTSWGNDRRETQRRCCDAIDSTSSPATTVSTLLRFRFSSLGAPGVDRTDDGLSKRQSVDAPQLGHDSWSGFTSAAQDEQRMSPISLPTLLIRCHRRAKQTGK